MKTLFLLAWILAWNIFQQMKVCEASHTSMCLALPVNQNNMNRKSLGIEHLFPAEVWEYFIQPVEKNRSVSAINPDRPTIRLHGIEVKGPGTGDGNARNLRGWLRVSVTLKSSLGFVICGHDGRKQAVGQFSDAKFPTTCGRTLDKIKYNIIPCTGVPIYEPQVPNCIVYVNPDQANWNWNAKPNSPLKGLSSPPENLTFFWHFSQQPCNLKKKILFKGYFIQKKDTKAIYHPWYRDVILQDEYTFGAADPAPDLSHVISCNKELSPGYPEWVKEVEGDENNWTYIYGPPHSHMEENTGCQADYFGGRCSKIVSHDREGLMETEEAGVDNLPKCQEIVSVDDKGYKNYDQYLEEKWKENECRECKEEQTGITAPESSKIPDYSNGLPVDTKMGRIIWGLRMGHGLCMVIVTIFLTPISVFITRYYKESFMNTRIVYLHFWHFIHIQVTFLTLALIVAGMIPVLMSRYFVGTSESFATNLHQIGGWLSILLVFCLAMFGGFRVSHVMSICAHWFFGLCFYILCYLLIWNSLYIPASPIANYDASYKEKNDAELDDACWCLIVWIVVDITLHVVMTFMGCKDDSSMHLTANRIYALPPIPVIHKDTKIDAPGTDCRLGFIFVHAGIATIVTIMMCHLIIQSKSVGRTYGIMSCLPQNASMQDAPDGCRFILEPSNSIIPRGLGHSFRDDPNVDYYEYF